MYSTSIRLTIVQGISPLKASVACLFFGGIGLVQLPLTSKMLERYTPGGCSSPAWSSSAPAGWFAGVPTSDRTLTAIVGPLILAGVGSALAFAAISAVASTRCPTTSPAWQAVPRARSGISGSRSAPRSWALSR